jgi:phytoene dehydrogenase-like protein
MCQGHSEQFRYGGVSIRHGTPVTEIIISKRRALLGGGECVLTVDEYRRKALEADLKALRATDLPMRAAYESLSQSLRELAEQAEWILLKQYS